MSFDSASFWIFFAAAWLLWRALPFTAAKRVTLLTSLFFYAWWNPLYIPLIVISAAVDYIAGARIHAGRTGRSRKAWLLASLTVNLGLLATFKYGPFVLENAGRAAALLGLGLGTPILRDWVIPVGISFYTFQTMSYSLDIYRGKLEPVTSFSDFFLYVAFFPQLVAGPIVRASELLPQLRRRRKLRAPAVHQGLYCIIWGLFMKIVVADNLALPVDTLFDMHTLAAASPATVWLGVIYFSVQIYADFAGYSSIAIGLALLMGLRFPENFRSPYISSRLSEFWTRWHVTLSRWLRDYLYISLGGNRKGRARTYGNLMATMLLGGLWHGASWTFVGWGALHGLGLCVERLFRRRGARRRPHQYRVDGRIPVRRALAALCRMALVFVFLQATWVFFRAESFEMAWLALERMFLAPFREPFIGILVNPRFVLLLMPVALAHIWQLGREWYGLRTSPYLRGAVAALMVLLLILLARPDKHAFIYFQF